MAPDDLEAPDLPPPVLLPEMPDEALAALVSAGNVEGVASALREQMVRLPAVLRQLDRVLDEGLGNLGATLATMLIARFKVSQAGSLAERVLQAEGTAGTDELVDLAAALINQERLKAARRVLTAALAKDPKHDRGQYFSARLSARAGDVVAAFERIARVSPKVLGGYGLAVQARYARLAGRPKAAAGALKLAAKHARDDADALDQLAHARRVGERLERLGIDAAQGFTLREAMAVEYGCALLELASDPADHGRFGVEAITGGDLARLLRTIAANIEPRFGPVRRLLHATEDGEIVAAGLSQLIGCPYLAFAKHDGVEDGDWLCMASAATHPHLPNDVVGALAAALDSGVLRTIALVLPAGWRGPIVPDVLGRLTGDDELPWAFDDEPEDALELCWDADPSSIVAEGGAGALPGDLDRLQPVLRAAMGLPRDPPAPYLDETPVPRRG